MTLAPRALVSIVFAAACFAACDFPEPQRCEDGCGTHASCDVATGYCVMKPMLPAVRPSIDGGQAQHDAGPSNLGDGAQVSDAGPPGQAHDAGSWFADSGSDAGPVGVDAGPPQGPIDAGPAPCVCAEGYSCAVGTGVCQVAFNGLAWAAPTPSMASLSNAADLGVAVTLAAVPGLLPTAQPARVTLRVSTNGSAFVTTSLASASGLRFFRAFSPAAEGTWRVEALWAGQSTGEREFTIDRTAPSLTAAVQAVPMRPPSWPEPARWRRDERPRVLLTADEPVTLGPQDLAFEGNVLIPVALSACVDAGLPCAVDASRCACVQLDLSMHPMPALKATARLEAGATDRAGNVRARTAVASFDVTRVRYVRPGSANSAARATPALDASGNLYTTQTDSAVRALTPLGEDRSGFSTPMGFGKSNAITVDNANGRLYYAQSSTNPLGGTSVGSLRSCILNTGASLGSATLGREMNLAIPLIALDGTAATIRAVGIGNDLNAAYVTAWAPGAPMLVDTVSISVPSVAVNAETAATPVVRGNALHLPLGHTLFPRWFNGVSWNTSTVPFPIHATGLALGGDVQTLGLTRRESDAVYGTSSGGPVLLGAGNNPRPSAPVFSAAHTLVVAFKEPARGVLKAYNLVPPVQVTELASWTPAEDIAGAPVLGASGFTYLATTTGRLVVAHGSSTWSDVLPGSGPVFAAPNLDCNRLQPEAGRPGTLYVMRGDGTVVSVLVDSAKLEPTAPWPRFQKDAANSGNADASVFPLNPGCP